jgi:hypothetical protein
VQVVADPRISLPPFRLPFTFPSAPHHHLPTSARFFLNLLVSSHQIISFPTTTIMAAAAASPPVNGDPSSQVDLSTIPISPDRANGHDENNTSNGSSSEEQITVFHDPDNFNVKHPLMNKWTLWFTKPPSGKVGLRQQHFTFNMLTSSLG